MLTQITNMQLLALEAARLKAEKKLRPPHVSMIKRHNVHAALEIARVCRDILGGNGITLEYPIMRHMCNLETVFTYEGTHDIHTLILGQEVTGHRGVRVEPGSRARRSVSASVSPCRSRRAHPIIAERFVEDDAHGVREVERADGPERGDSDDPVGEAREELLGQAHALLAEDERVPGGVGAVEVALSRDRAEKVQLAARATPSTRRGGSARNRRACRTSTRCQ